ncbi:hypothetical protein NHX12_003583 [Muraenolepis orangiensis]|uniref:Uncharacterized protein n=1 Tax=Muraenolepis orangiensis TaxID=630683 RepID=A0A9Q0E124_9TELE|nr:hypothetical protein NHX12_003583 [Muraenolepis orangiensis]
MAPGTSGEHGLHSKPLFGRPKRYVGRPAVAVRKRWHCCRAICHTLYFHLLARNRSSRPSCGTILAQQVKCKRCERRSTAAGPLTGLVFTGLGVEGTG